MTPLRAILCIVSLCIALSWPIWAGAEGGRIHGENSRFATNGVVLVWGVLRGATDDSAKVVLRVVNTGRTYRAVSLEGVDPFGGARQTLFPRAPLADGVVIWTARATFADVPQREIHLFTDPGAAYPTLTIYFQGLPDTTPEFDSETALSRYLEETVAELSKK
jgi:hypothetical protein